MALAPARLRPRDIVRVGGHGLRTRPLRAFLSALGIAIGIAAMVAVVGISSSSQANFDALLAKLGTNLLTVTPGQNLLTGDAELPAEAIGMVGRIGPVESVAGTGAVTGTYVYRNDHIPAEQNNSIAVLAAQTGLPATVGAHLAGGTWLNAATSRYPAVVLGATAADRLGLGTSTPDAQVWLGGRWFTVAGILDPVPLAPELDTAALIGWPEATGQLGFDGHPTTIYERSTDPAVNAVAAVLPATADPAHPEQVDVSRPSDAIKARDAANESFTGLLLGLGGVALLVGGVGVANTMVISVLERRSEIGLRRALGATRAQIRSQFLAEAALLSALGGIAGVLLGVGVTAGYAANKHWPTSVPSWIMIGGVAATLFIGIVAGLYPAMRAARLAPSEALATP
ncbi:MAG TPA: ABC transporter permease [Mycobacteriales bacterium]|nr:ABC transporter permease [Mycobacteriales bacterium]